VEGDGEDHHRRLGQMALEPFRLVFIEVQMGNQLVEEQHEGGAAPKSADGRQKGQPAEMGALLHRRDQEAPDRCCDHDAGGKAGQRALQPL